MTTTNNTELVELIFRVARWEKSGSDFIGRIAGDFGKLKPETHCVTPAQLVNVDPRLPLVMDAYFANASAHNETSVTGTTVRMAVRCLAFNVLVHDADNIERYLISFEGYLPQDDAHVVIVGNSHWAKRLNPGSADADAIYYPAGNMRKEFTATRHYLDTRYPGWEERYEQALTLGYSTSEAGQFLFQQSGAVRDLALPDTNLGFAL